MDPKKAEEQAALLAREVVTRGIATQEVVRKAYFEYVEITRRVGFRGTFAQFLIARNLADRDRVAALPSSGMAGRPPSDRQSPLTQNFQKSAVQAMAAADEESEGGRTMQMTPDVIAAQLADAAKRRGVADPFDAGRASRDPQAFSATQQFTSGVAQSLADTRGARTPSPLTPAPTPAAMTPPPPTRTPPPVTTTPRPPTRTPLPPPDKGGMLSVDEDGSVPELAVPGSADEDEVPEGVVENGRPVGKPAKKPAPAPAVNVDEFTMSSMDDDKGKPSARQEEDAATRRAVKELIGAKGGSADSVETADGEDDDDEKPADVPEVKLRGALGPNGEPLEGACLGKYEVQGQLGRGGMAVVYKVKDNETGRLLAMKILTGGDRPGAEKRRARFRREVRAVQRLDHPNIVKIHDSGRSGPLDFYIMDLIDGEDFEKALQKDRFDLEKRMEIVEGIARAMAHAHERGVIHRDLKPQNVLLDIRARPKVVDFGLAKLKNDEVSLTRTNTALGTPFYMAPEQHKNAKDIDQRADVFALGVIVYECATGQRPFTGETAAEVGHKVLTLEPPLPSKVKPGVPPQIDAIVLKAMEKDPTRRYQSAGQLLIDLIRARAGKEVVGAKGATGLSATMRRVVEKNRAAVVVGVVVALLFLPIVVYLALHRDSKPVAPKTPPPPPVDPSTPPAPPRPPVVGPQPPAPPQVTPPAPPTPPTTPPTTPPVTPTPPPPPKPPTPAVVSPVPPPVPQPPAPPPPAVPQPATELGKAIAELKIPDEPADGGVDILGQTFRTPEQGLAFLHVYERLIEMPLERGDVDGAIKGQKEIPSDPVVTTWPPLAKDELARDLEVIAKLRRVVVEKLRADPKLLGSADVHGVDRIALRGPPRLVEEDALEFQAGNAKVTIEPLALSTRTLEKLLEKEPPIVKTALALLALRRGEDPRAHLKTLLPAPFASHRLAWADLAKPIRDAALASIEASARTEFQSIEADRGKYRIGNIDALEKRLADFRKAYGRYESYRSRRVDFLRVATESIPWERTVAPVVEDKVKALWDVRWKLETKSKKHLGDFELFATDPEKPFRADFDATGLNVENATLACPLEDRGSTHWIVRFLSPENEPVTLLAGPYTVALDVKDEVQLKDDRGALLKRDKPKGLQIRTTHVIELQRIEENKEFFLLGRLGKEDLLKLPLKGDKLPDAKPSANRVGLSTLGRCRINQVDLQAIKVPGGKRELEARAHERALIEARADDFRALGRTLVDGRKGREVLLEGEWRMGDGLEALSSGSKPAILTALRDTADAEVSFEYRLEDGPGIKVELGRGAGSPSWVLPGSAQSPEFRKVVVTYEVVGSRGAATCIVDDAIRLDTKLNLAREKIPLKLTLLGRTKATIRNFKVTELSRYSPR